jgi:ferredoxin
MRDSTKTLVVNILRSADDSASHVVIKFEGAVNLLKVLNANKIGISQECGGHGTCTTCRVRVQGPGACFSERTEIEKERADERRYSEAERLACQTEILDSAVIELWLNEV